MLEPPSLILLDEIGRGTDPAQGSALGIAVIDFFRERRHMSLQPHIRRQLKPLRSILLKSRTPAWNSTRLSLRPTYRLRFGLAGESSGLEIASQLGMPSPILVQARERLSRRDIEAESYLARLREELDSLGREKGKLREQLEQLKDQQRRLDAEFQEKEKERRVVAEKTVKEWKAEFRRKVEQLLESVQDELESARVKKEIKLKAPRLEQSLQRSMDPAAPAEDVCIQESDRVYHSFFQKRGIVLHVGNGEATVEIEGKRVTAPINQLQKVEGEESPQELPKNVILNENVILNVVEEKTEPELNLIGCAVDDALTRVDKFLDRAFLSRLPEVRIIHGFGTGKLRAALSEFLQSHPHVSEHHAKGGATVVRME